MKKTQAEFENLVRHLVEVEENGEGIIDDYYPLPSKDREELLSLLEEYLQEVRGLVEGKAQIDFSKFPFVIIGCRVLCADLNSGESIEYKITAPFGEEIKANDVSCFSPIGRALLLKSVTDEISVQIPVGIINYRIEAIRYDPE